MYMRRAFSICAHVDPEIMIIDEALAVGDAAFRDKCLDFLNRFRTRGSIVLVSHDAKQIAQMCDDAIWIDKGRIRASGVPAEVVAQYESAARTERDDPSRFVIEEAAPPRAR